MSEGQEFAVGERVAIVKESAGGAVSAKPVETLDIGTIVDYSPPLNSSPLMYGISRNDDGSRDYVFLGGGRVVDNTCVSPGDWHCGPELEEIYKLTRVDDREFGRGFEAAFWNEVENLRRCVGSVNDIPGRATMLATLRNLSRYFSGKKSD